MFRVTSSWLYVYKPPTDDDNNRTMRRRGGKRVLTARTPQTDGTVCVSPRRRPPSAQVGYTVSIRVDSPSTGPSVRRSSCKQFEVVMVAASLLAAVDSFTSRLLSRTLRPCVGRGIIVSYLPAHVPFRMSSVCKTFDILQISRSKQATSPPPMAVMRYTPVDCHHFGLLVSK